eukprot:s8807_g3.t1
MAVYAQKGISDSQTTCIRIVGRLHFSQLFLELLWRILQHTSETIAPHREQRQPCRPQEQHITSQSRASSAIRHGGHRCRFRFARSRQVANTCRSQRRLNLCRTVCSVSSPSHSRELA